MFSSDSVVIFEKSRTSNLQKCALNLKCYCVSVATVSKH